MDTKKPKLKLTLKAIRVNMGKTQEEMGKLYGVSKEVVFNWETHKTYPSVKDVPKIEKATGLKYDDILFLPQNDDLIVDNEEK